MLAPLTIRNFRMLFTAQVFSDFGNWLEVIALTTLVAYRWDLGADAMAAYFIFLCLPYVLLGPFLGVLADRLDRRTLMIFSDLSRMTLMIGFIWVPNLSVLLVLLFLKGALTTLFNCAKQGTIRQIVPEEALLQANSLNATSANLSKFLGPILGAMLLALMSMEQIFMLMGTFFLVSTFFLTRLPSLRTPREQQRQASYWQEFKFGLTYIPSNKILLAVTVFFVIECVAMYAFEPQIPLLVKEAGFADYQYPYFVSMVGVGSITAASILSKWGARFQPSAMLPFGTLTLGTALLLLAYGGYGTLPVTHLSWLLIFIVVGLGIGVLGVCYGYLLQISTPPELMGRVAGSFESIVYGGILGGTLIGGAIANLWNIPTVFAYAGVLLIILGIGFTLLTRWLRIAPTQQVTNAQQATGA